MSVDGGNDQSTSKLITAPEISLGKTTGTPIDLKVDLEDYDRCADLLNGV